MPWGIFKEGELWCIHKLTDDNGKGEKLACHETEEKAQAQITALNIAESGERSFRRVSFIDDVEGIITGYIAIWGNPEQRDAYDTWFDKSRPPELDEDLLPIALRYEHGMDAIIGTSRIGEVHEIYHDNVGIGFRARLDKTSPFFERIVMELRSGTADGWLCTSSGSQEYLTKFRNDGSFEVWPLGELSLTAYPAEQRMPQVELIRSKRQAVADGTDTNLQIDESQETTNDNNEVDRSISTNNNEGEFRMLEQLLSILGGLPENADLGQVIAAFMDAGVTAEDLQAAIDMLKEPEEEERSEEEPRNAMTDAERLAHALAGVIEQQQHANTQTANAELEAENRSLRAQMALNAARQSAPPAARSQRGDTTDGGHGNVRAEVSEPQIYDHLDAQSMALVLEVIPGKRRDEKFMRSMATKVANELESHRNGKPQWRNQQDYSAIRSAFPYRADELMATNISGQGQEWVGAYYNTNLWEKIRQSKVFDTLRGMGMWEQEVPDGASNTVIALEGADPTWYTASEANDVDSTSRPEVVMGAPSYIGTSNVTVTPKKAATRVLISTELTEDSFIPVASQYQRQLEESAQDVMEYILINGDTETAASTNINLIDGTPASGINAPVYLNSDGVIKLALVTNTANGRDGGALTSADYLETRKLLGTNLAADPNNIAYLVDTTTMLKSLELLDLKTQDVFRMATLENGVMTAVYGSPVLTSGQMALANAAGKISATAGNNTLGRIAAIVPRYWALVWKRQITIKTAEDIESDTQKIVVSMRLAFQKRTNEASAVSYNLTV